MKIVIYILFYIIYVQNFLSFMLIFNPVFSIQMSLIFLILFLIYNCQIFQPFFYKLAPILTTFCQHIIILFIFKFFSHFILFFQMYISLNNIFQPQLYFFLLSITFFLFHLLFFNKIKLDLFSNEVAVFTYNFLYYFF